MSLTRSSTDLSLNFIIVERTNSTIVKRLPMWFIPAKHTVQSFKKTNISNCVWYSWWIKVLVNSSLLILKEVYLCGFFCLFLVWFVVVCLFVLSCVLFCLFVLFYFRKVWSLLLQHVFILWKSFLWSSIKLLVTSISETQMHKKIKYS